MEISRVNSIEILLRFHSDLLSMIYSIENDHNLKFKLILKLPVV